MVAKLTLFLLALAILAPAKPAKPTAPPKSEAVVPCPPELIKQKRGKTVVCVDEFGLESKSFNITSPVLKVEKPPNLPLKEVRGFWNFIRIALTLPFLALVLIVGQLKRKHGRVYTGSSRRKQLMQVCDNIVGKFKAVHTSTVCPERSVCRNKFSSCPGVYEFTAKVPHWLNKASVTVSLRSDVHPNDEFGWRPDEFEKCIGEFLAEFMVGFPINLTFCWYKQHVVILFQGK